MFNLYLWILGRSPSAIPGKNPKGVACALLWWVFKMAYANMREDMSSWTKTYANFRDRHWANFVKFNTKEAFHVLKKTGIWKKYPTIVICKLIWSFQVPLPFFKSHSTYQVPSTGVVFFGDFHDFDKDLWFSCIIAFIMFKKIQEIVFYKKRIIIIE